MQGYGQNFLLEVIAMRTKLTLMVGLTLTLFLVAACGSASDTNAVSGLDEKASPTYKTLTIDGFADIMTGSSDQYTIINVHIPYAGEVEGTDTNVPFNDLDALTAAIPNKDAPVILYCRSGNMSEQASRALVDLGYTQVWDIPGGMAAWQASGRELIDQ
jgi:rhodanese-related sulfurtransferase